MRAECKGVGAALPQGCLVFCLAGLSAAFTCLDGIWVLSVMPLHGNVTYQKMRCVERPKVGQLPEKREQKGKQRKITIQE